MRFSEPLSRHARPPEDILQAVAEGTAAAIGEDFFRCLVQQLATTFEVRCCLVTETLTSPPSKAATLAAWKDQGFLERFEYDLAGTPCHHVLAGEAIIYRRDILSIFPEDRDLVDLGAESYAGVPFQDFDGRITGHLVLVDTDPFDEGGSYLSILKVFAARAGAELERLRATAALRASERTLREGEARLRQVIDLVPHCIFAKDCDGRFILGNQAVADVYGTTVEELLTRSDADFASSQEEAKHFRADDLEVIESGRPKIIPEEQITDSQGRVRYLQTTKIPFTYANSDAPSMLGVAVDITDRKQAEDERKKLEEQMRHGQKLESLGVLAGGIAHDFNNLLAGILGHVKLALAKLPPDTPVLGHLEGVEHSAQRAAELSNQMLAYSGQGRFVVERISLATVVQEMIDLVRSSISKRAALKIDMKSDLPLIEADVTEIRQVVLNLILNASEALGDEEGEISLRTRVVEAGSDYLAKTYLNDGLPEGRYVVFEVTDTGCGMNDSTRARIFDPFFTTKFSGRGLGLAAVLGIVRGHSGAIEIDSEPGTGTTFRTLFPATEATAESLAPPKAETAIHGEGRTVLVVDDDAIVRRVAQSILEHYGFRVLCAEDGQAALEAVNGNGSEIEVVLLDMTMPHLDGIETLRALRHQQSKLAVVLTSGYSEQEASRRMKGQEAVAFIQKPFLPEDLCKAIGQALETVGSERGAVREESAPAPRAIG